MYTFDSKTKTILESFGWTGKSRHSLSEVKDVLKACSEENSLTKGASILHPIAEEFFSRMEGVQIIVSSQIGNLNTLKDISFDIDTIQILPVSAWFPEVKKFLGLHLIPIGRVVHAKALVSLPEYLKLSSEEIHRLALFETYSSILIGETGSLYMHAMRYFSQIGLTVEDSIQRLFESNELWQISESYTVTVPDDVWGV